VAKCDALAATRNWIASGFAGGDVDHIVPGHGPVVTKAYLDVQIGFIYEWIGAVATGVAKGWSQEECIAKINFKSRYPVDIGQDESMDYIQRTNVIKCYRYITEPQSSLR